MATETTDTHNNMDQAAVKLYRVLSSYLTIRFDHVGVCIFFLDRNQSR